MRKLNVLAVIGLALGAALGLAGSMVKESNLQASFYEISSIGLIFASVLLSLKYFRSGNDFVSAGFLLFAIAEGVMSAGTASGQVGGQSSFAAGMALYIPALWFICIPKQFAIWIRIAGMAASIPFAIASAKIYWGEQVLSTTPFPSAGYTILTIMIIGLIWTLLREKNQ